MSRPRRPARDLRRLAPPALAAALAALYLVWQPPSLDLAAAEHRAWLFGEEGFAIWNGGWYAGHHLPGYSVLFPPLAHWLGPRVVGALAVVAAAWLFERLAYARYGPPSWLGATWFAAGAAALLLSGRMPFALGLVPALGALLALAASAPRPARSAFAALAVGLAALTALASPVAALFLALAATSYALGERRLGGLAVAVAAMAPVVALAVAFPEGGIEPFVASAYWPVIAFAVVALRLLPREERTLRIGVVLYALGCTAAFLLDTPLGGNATRLGALCAGPLAALVLWPRRTLALALLAPFLLWWQWTAAVRDVSTASGDPSVHAAYYAPLLAALERAGAGDGSAGRVEIPFTRAHWEARWVAGGTGERAGGGAAGGGAAGGGAAGGGAAGGGGRRGLPLARGWERQLDLQVNPLFYGARTGAPPLTPARYRSWLSDMAVRWVALPDVPLDGSAEAEAALIERGLPYLRQLWRGRHWRLYEVRDATPLADPPARVTAIGADTLSLSVARPANVRLRVRWTPYWAVVAGDACVEADGEWTRLRVRRAGEVRLATRFALGRIGARGPRCA